MYNRYIPQPDGTFRRSTVADPLPITSHTKNASAEPTDSKPTASAASAAQKFTKPQMRPHYTQSPPRNIPQTDHGSSVTAFIKQLLPKNFDTEDLIVVLLLLLMTGNNRDDQNTALLTLLLYLFL